MKFIIVIPVHNEEKYITSCIASLENQIFQHFEIVLVNDGSTDGTEELLEELKCYTSTKIIKNIHLPVSEYKPGEKVVKAFNIGLKNRRRYEKANKIICKVDADIVFPKDYFYQLNKMFEEDEQLGMASGIVKVNTSGQEEEDIFDFSNQKGIWKFENISSKNHVRGPIKAYRRACFNQMNGLRPVLGWDNIDVMLAKKNGWKVATKKDLWVKHLRPTAQKYQKDKAEKQGKYFYNIGLDFRLACLSALKSSWRNKSLKQFFQTMKSFREQQHERVLTEEEIQFIRDLRWKEIKAKFKF